MEFARRRARHERVAVQSLPINTASGIVESCSGRVRLRLFARALACNEQRATQIMRLIINRRRRCRRLSVFSYVSVDVVFCTHDAGVHTHSFSEVY